MSRILTAVLIALCLAGCGFHLREALSLPSDLGPVRVIARDQYSPLADSLSQALLRAGATVVEGTAEQPVATLAVLSERWASTPISIDERGRAQEYSLRYAVVFRLSRADGGDLVPQQVVELSRDYISSPDNLTGTDSERELLARELRREMTASIVRRIDGATRGAEPPAELETGPELQMEPEPELQMEPEPELQMEPEPELQMEPEPELQMEPEPESP